MLSAPLVAYAPHGSGSFCSVVLGCSIKPVSDGKDAADDAQDSDANGQDLIDQVQSFSLIKILLGLDLSSQIDPCTQRLLLLRKGYGRLGHFLRATIRLWAQGTLLG